MGQSGESWEDVYPDVLEDLKACGTTRESRTEVVKELLGYEISVEEPATRCLRNEGSFFNVFQALGHWLWIMAGRQDFPFISFYNKDARRFSSDGFRLHGAYGPRLSGIGVYDQINKCIELINSTNQTRRALAPVFIPSYELAENRFEEDHSDEIPCPVALHFIPRAGELHLITYMRSQDAYRLLPLDMFTFTLIQEYVASSTSNDLGSYVHYSGSIHYREKHEGDVDSIIQMSDRPSAAKMPLMSSEKPHKNLQKLLELEERIRVKSTRSKTQGEKFSCEGYLEEIEELPDFWGLAGKMILFWGLFHVENIDAMKRIKNTMHDSADLFAERSIEGTKDS